ncbi:hypothetical protein, partial [Pseudomonas fluorescens]|uniref:hypothetical protein n=1 Tax=Pseudomonas fluorescens TaxID=294 RepID=UPI0012414432
MAVYHSTTISNGMPPSLAGSLPKGSSLGTQFAQFPAIPRLEAAMLHSHLTTLNAVSLVLNAF